MADLRYRAEIDTSGAVRSLDNLKNTVASLGAAIGSALAFREVSTIAASFENLRTTLQILYKDAQVGALAFDDIKKFAAESVFSVNDLTETVIKLKAAGLEPTVALLRLFADTSSVAADSVGALQAITDLYARTTAGGLGLEDLNRLADRGIPVYTILAQKLGISRLEISKIGQTADGARLILQALEVGLQETFGGASAARVGTLSQAYSNFGDSLANAADKFGQSGFNEGMAKLLKAVSDLIVQLGPLIEALGSGLGGVLQFTAKYAKELSALLIGIAAGYIAAGVLRLASAFVLLGKAMLATPAGRLAAALGIIAGAFVGLKNELTDVQTEIDNVPNSEGFKVFQSGELGKGTENFKQRARDLNQELQKFRAEMANVVKEFARLNDITIKAVQLETSLIGATREQSEVERARAELMKRSQDEIAKLIAAKGKLTEAERKEGRGEIIDQQIAKIKQVTEADLIRTEEAIRNQERRQQARQFELYSIQRQIDFTNELQSIQDDIAKMTMNEIEKKYYDIDAAARRSAKSAIEAEEARRGAKMPIEEQRKYYEEAAKGNEQLKRAAEEQYIRSRQFSTGWAQAFNEYVDNATNAANRARAIFQKVTQGMEDLIVNFAKTGKFEFKGFINSILEELLRSQIRQAMAQIFSIGGGRVGGGGGGLLGGLFSGFFAAGGMIPAGRFGVVGEAGPELVTGPAQVTPMNMGQVTYNINAVDAASFKQMVARDPAFIHAIAMQGGRATPGRR